MTINSRRKGAQAERELAGEIDNWLGVRPLRNLDQVRDGGHDLVAEGESPAAQALDRYAIEVKRHRRATPALVRKWWQQAVEQADAAGRIPCLAVREDRGEWGLYVPVFAVNSDLGQSLDIEHCARLTVRGFCTIVRESISSG